MDYSDYLKFAEEEHIEKINKGRKIAKLSDEIIKLVKEINDPVNIIVFGETRCGDVATALPYLMDMANVNSNIKFDILRREGNEEMLKELSGEDRIPTFIKVDSNGGAIKSYIEFPQVVKENIEKNIDEKEKIVFDFRDGKYKEELEKEIYELIIH
ncbi:MAG: thioredoxin family protein [Clostridium sp.]